MNMKKWSLIYSFALVLILIVPVSQTYAQEPENTRYIYYVDKKTDQLDFLLLSNNICLESVLMLNPDLDINHVEYGQRILVPVNEPCYQYDQSEYGWWNFSDGYPPRLKYYENGQWLDEPYYSDEVVYLRRDLTLEDISLKYNVCEDVLLAHNILLQNDEDYTQFPVISMDIFIPEDAPPCNPSWVPPSQPTESDNLVTIQLRRQDITPLFFVEYYNICAEDLGSAFSNGWFYNVGRESTTETIQIPTDAPPCYNEAGQRLQYYDELGNKLDEPIYSGLEVYVTNPGEKLHEIAEEFDVCLVDLLRVNGFPDVPLTVPIELLIPEQHDCPDNIQTYYYDDEGHDLEDVSIDLNICADVLLSLNPHFTELGHSWHFSNHIYQNRQQPTWIIIPTNPTPCYFEYHPMKGDSLFDIERELNICYQEFRVRQGYFLARVPHDDLTVYIANDAPSCYNENMQRLQYPYAYPVSFKQFVETGDLEYADMTIHIFSPGETIYGISQEYNVCVFDLLEANPIFERWFPAGYPTLIPDTRPCYDEATGLPLIYEDEDGNPLPEPEVGEHLIFYDYGTIEPARYYYNVCINRILDANQAKIRGEVNYLGWIIPTDRPPCYDENLDQIHYVCYSEPMDFTVDYSQVAEDISFDVGGAHCYALDDPETVIWHKNKPYQAINYKNDILMSRAFTAWCYGVSLEEIDEINADEAAIEVLPEAGWRLIPQPTRECYIDNPEILRDQQVYQAQYGETLSDIAAQYDKPYQWLAFTNNLDDQNMIWAGQLLIIPSGPTIKQISVVAAGVVSFAGLIYWRKRRRYGKKKKKNAG